jgi:hypothetical protein
MPPQKQKDHKVPEEFRVYFWDVQFEDLSTDKNSRFIAERILNFGNSDAVRWMFSWADKDYIRSVIENSRNLNAKSRNFWKKFFEQDN